MERRDVFNSDEKRWRRDQVEATLTKLRTLGEMCAKEAATNHQKVVL